MKVIFLQNVKGQGMIDEVKEVSDGYAKNFLIPRGLVKPATVGAVKTVQIKQQVNKEEQVLAKAETLQLKTKLEELTLSFKLQIKNNKAFGSISNADIVEQLKNVYKIEVDKRKFVNFKNLHEIGINYVKIKLDFQIDAMLKIEIQEA